MLCFVIQQPHPSIESVENERPKNVLSSGGPGGNRGPHPHGEPQQRDFVPHAGQRVGDHGDELRPEKSDFVLLASTAARDRRPCFRKFVDAAAAVFPLIVLLACRYHCRCCCLTCRCIYRRRRCCCCLCFMFFLHFVIILVFGFILLLVFSLSLFPSLPCLHISEYDKHRCPGDVQAV